MIEFQNLIGNFYSAENKKIYPLSHPTFFWYNKGFIENAHKYYQKIRKIINIRS